MALLQIPTYSQVIQIVRSRILSQNNSISTLPGSVAGDLYTVPQSLSDVQQYAVIYYYATQDSVTELLALEQNSPYLTLISQAMNLTVTDILSDIANQLNRLGNNYGVTRAQAQYATGAVLLGRVDPPTSDIMVNAGTVVSSSSGVQYTTTSTVVMYASAAGSYYNTNLLGFFISVPVQANTIGSVGNAPAPSINTVVTPIAGLPLVTNVVDMAGGEDVQSDTDFGAAILAKWQSLGTVTQQGPVTSVLNNTVATDAYMAGQGDPLAVRGFGKADLYVQGVTQQQFTETFNGFNSQLFSDGITPSNLPLVAVESATSGTPFLQADTTSALAGSVQAQDAVRFAAPPTFPVTVTYTVNANVTNAQAVFNTPTLAPLNYQAPSTPLAAVQTPLLVKAAPQVLIDYITSITVAPGYVKSQVVPQVQSALATYFNGLTLGQTAYLADVNTLVEGVTGVLRAAGVPTKFNLTSGAGVVQSITPANNAYLVLNNVGIY